MSAEILPFPDPRSPRLRPRPRPPGPFRDRHPSAGGGRSPDRPLRAVPRPDAPPRRVPDGTHHAAALGPPSTEDLPPCA